MPNTDNDSETITAELAAALRGASTVFRELWLLFCEGAYPDGPALEQIFKRGGLAEWRPCTAEEAARLNCDVEAGDPVMFLTAHGKAVLEVGRTAWLATEEDANETSP